MCGKIGREGKRQFSTFAGSAQWQNFQPWEMCTMEKSHIGEHTIRQLLTEEPLLKTLTNGKKEERRDRRLKERESQQSGEDVIQS
ncbi:hypothetical protein ES705_45142 [subsurface metagenome]